jgi:hypothetical protein
MVKYNIGFNRIQPKAIIYISGEIVILTNNRMIPCLKYWIES